ncbi:MAG: biotin transporter BioY [Spirochaetales bacterium]
MHEIKSQKRNIRSVFTALFAAIIAVCGFISIPVPASPVPIVLQNMMPILAAALLGGLQGAGATGLFLIAGALGLPVFSGATGGVGVLLGPTGGFLIGYFIASLAVGFVMGKPSPAKKTPLPKIISACLLGFILIYIPGIIQFMTVLDLSLSNALAASVIPFLPGDGIKLVLTVSLATKIRPIIARYLFDE